MEKAIQPLLAVSYTHLEQRFIIPMPFASFPTCTHAVIGGVRQKITGVIDLTPRYTVIQVSVYKE